MLQRPVNILERKSFFIHFLPERFPSLKFLFFLPSLNRHDAIRFMWHDEGKIIITKLANGMKGFNFMDMARL